MTTGIKNLIELKTFLVAVYDGVQRARQDGKLDASDFAYFGPALMAAPAAISSVGEIGDELRDIDGDELTELLGDLQNVLGITGDEASIYFAEGFQILKSFWAIIKAARAKAA